MENLEFVLILKTITFVLNITYIMDIQLEKLDLIEWITRISDKTILKKLVGIKEESSILNDWSIDLSKKEIDSISRGLKDVEYGNVQSHESVKEIYEKYL